jgi:FxsC-like protein
MEAALGGEQMESGPAHQPYLAVFAIETAAPTTGAVAIGHDPGGYGDTSTEWRPFPRQELSLTQYAGRVAERFRFKAEVSGIKTVRDPFTRGPGIILIDPWFIDDEDGRSALESAVEGLPPWVLPLLILDHPDDARVQKLADQVRDILGAARALPTGSSRRAALGVSSLDDFVSIVPVLVAEAERQYLRSRSKRAAQPNLRRTARLQRPVSTPDPLGEAPDV